MTPRNLLITLASFCFLMLVRVGTVEAGTTCSPYGNCTGGRQVSACVTVTDKGVCTSAYYKTNAGQTFPCASCTSCYDAAKQAANWCVGGSGPTQPTCTKPCGGGCCSGSEVCCANMCAPAGSACCGSGYCGAGKTCCASVCIPSGQTCCGTGYCGVGEVCSAGKCCPSATPVHANGACCASGDSDCICADGSACGGGKCCPTSHPYCCIGGGCANTAAQGCASAPNQPPPTGQTCYVGTEPCGSGCCEFYNFCCNGKCADAKSACCSGQVCTSGACCGNGCLPAAATCCPDGSNCPSNTPVCCEGGGCAADGASCSAGQAACSPQDIPCSGGCCSLGTPTCCSGGCAPAGSICCSNGLFCQQDHPTCCGSYCCDLGSTCSDTKHCVRATGALPPGTIPAKSGKSGAAATSPTAGEPVSKGAAPPGSRSRAAEYGFGYSCGGCEGDGADGDGGTSVAPKDATGSREPVAPLGLGALLGSSGSQGLALVCLVLLGLACLRRRRR